MFDTRSTDFYPTVSTRSYPGVLIPVHTMRIKFIADAFHKCFPLQNDRLRLQVNWRRRHERKSAYRACWCAHRHGGPCAFPLFPCRCLCDGFACATRRRRNAHATRYHARTETLDIEKVPTVSMFLFHFWDLIVL